MCFLYVSMYGLYCFFSSRVCFEVLFGGCFFKIYLFCCLGFFFCGSRPPDHFVANTFTFTALIVGELAQGVSEIAYLVPGSKAKVRIVKDEAFTIRVTAKTGLLRSWKVWLGVQNTLLQTRLWHLRDNLCLT